MKKLIILSVVLITLINCTNKKLEVTDAAKEESGAKIIVSPIL